MLTISPAVEQKLKPANCAALRAGSGVPDEYECYACGGIGRPATDDSVISVLTGAPVEVIILGHARCTGSQVLREKEFNAITARRTRSDGASLPSQGAVITDGRLHERPEGQPMPETEVKNCPSGGLHPVPQGCGTGQPAADRLVAGHYARCQPCSVAALEAIDATRQIPALVALVVNWVANCSQAAGKRRGLHGQEAVEAWRATLTLDAPRPALQAAAGVTYLVGGSGEAHFEAGRLDAQLHSLTRRQRREVAEYALDGVLGLLSMLDH
ncbi:hypothetical protein ACPXCO_37520 [Streptomyces cyaneofuscatus]|uniref:hypothetical protein n=1 Tax=Streptomyces cyaneofuscatus TaxID=66883 RepID=UPI003CF76030